MPPVCSHYSNRLKTPTVRTPLISETTGQRMCPFHGTERVSLERSLTRPRLGYVCVVCCSLRNSPVFQTFYSRLRAYIGTGDGSELVEYGDTDLYFEDPLRIVPSLLTPNYSFC